MGCPGEVRASFVAAVPPRVEAPSAVHCASITTGTGVLNSAAQMSTVAWNAVRASGGNPS